MLDLRAQTDGDTDETFSAAPMRGGCETILIADDDEVVRNALASALRKLGYKVLEAGTGLEAVRLATAYEKPIDLVLADVVMPTLTTDDLRNRMALLQPGARLAFMSGYIHDPEVRKRVFHGPVPFLEKPFTVRQLANAVRRFIEARAA